MILSSKKLIKTKQHPAYEANAVMEMRGNIAATASIKNLELLGVEVIERTPLRQNKEGHWVSAKLENATHILIQIEQEAAPQ
jgi:hypothetical protein